MTLAVVGALSHGVCRDGGFCSVTGLAVVGALSHGVYRDGGFCSVTGLVVVVLLLHGVYHGRDCSVTRLVTLCVFLQRYDAGGCWSVISRGIPRQ